MKRLLLIVSLAFAGLDVSALSINHPCNPANPIGLLNPASPIYVGRNSSSGNSRHYGTVELYDDAMRDVRDNRMFYLACAITFISFACALYLGMGKDR